MIIYFTDKALKIHDYRIISGLHPASRRFGVEGLFTTTIMYNNIIYPALLYKNKLIAIHKNDLWYATLDTYTDKFPNINGIHTFNNSTYNTDDEDI